MGSVYRQQELGGLFRDPGALIPFPPARPLELSHPLPVSGIRREHRECFMGCLMLMSCAAGSVPDVAQATDADQLLTTRQAQQANPCGGHILGW